MPSAVANESPDGWACRSPRPVAIGGSVGEYVAQSGSAHPCVMPRIGEVEPGGGFEEHVGHLSSLHLVVEVVGDAFDGKELRPRDRPAIA
jgi:hypothetical protein